MNKINNEREFLKRLKALDDDLNDLFVYCTTKGPSKLMMAFVYEVCAVIESYKDSHDIDEILDYMEENDVD